MSKVIATNRKARRDYVVLETMEAGIELKGGEVKSLRDARINLEDSFARIEDGQVILYNAHISPYQEASYLNVEPTRPRKLLLHAKQIERLAGQLAQKGFTLIPLKAYFSESGFAKIDLAVCKGKKLYDRREDLKRRETDLEMRRAIKGRKQR
ncbi:MAG: SsrA-binding protein SmpB [Candidatus Omnitrophica bacterium]|nr:SsrA-binding protein SmpB [Candidatus Omnitrophota bacterium]MDD5611027.1 SsrA-binding protein SmpB [Candidatus Omnitrophota bacterium]